MLESVNPTTEETLAVFDEHSDSEVEQRLTRAREAYQRWRRSPFEERGRLFHAAAAHLRANRDRFARLVTLEMGKPIAQAEAEIEKCAWTCEYFADQAAGFLANRHIATNAKDSYVAFEPLGVVLAVMPWNFPFWQLFRFAAPSLMAGNTAILKHASNVPQCALAIEEVFREAGFPAGTFQTLLIGGGRVGPLIEDDRIAAVTLTGSDIVGSKVAEAAGRALKKCVLELGGSDPFIVLADANLKRAAEVAVQARFQNTGQSCIASKRFLVEATVADEFEHEFVERVRLLRIGDPLASETQIGPVARQDLRDSLDRQVRGSTARGARVLVGGEPLAGRGYFYAPTVLTAVDPSMTVCLEETFGPIAPVVRVADATEAVHLANQSPFGLGSSVWTDDLERGQRLAREIEAGAVFINSLVASDPRLPFGGVKRSGYGRELSEFGIHEFVNVQTVWVGSSSGV